MFKTLVNLGRTIIYVLPRWIVFRDFCLREDYTPSPLNWRLIALTSRTTSFLVCATPSRKENYNGVFISLAPSSIWRHDYKHHKLLSLRREKNVRKENSLLSSPMLGHFFLLSIKEPFREACKIILVK